MSVLVTGIGVTVVGLGAAGGAAAKVKAAREREEELRKLSERLMGLASDFGIEYDEVFAFGNPNLGNAPLAGAAAYANAQLGLPVGGALQQGSPIGLLQNAAGSAGYTPEDFKRVSNSIGKAAAVYNNLVANGVDPGVAKQRAMKKSGAKGDIIKMLRLSGYANVIDFFEDQAAWEKEAEAFETELAKIAPEIRAGRLSALEAVSALQQDFPRVTQANIDDLEQRITKQRFNEIELNTRDALRDENAAANTFGTNPAASRARLLEREQILKDQVQGSEALREALLLLGAKTQIAGGSLVSLQNSLNVPINQAANVGGIISQGQAVQASNALRQALALTESRRINATNEAKTQLELMAQAFGLETSGELGTINAKESAAQDASQFTQQFGSFVAGGGFGGGAQTIQGPATQPSGNTFGIDSSGRFVDL